MNFLSLLFLFFIILLPGFAIWLVFANRLQLKLSGLETIFIWFLTGTAVVSWLSLTLAEFGFFSLALLLSLLLPVVGFMIGWAAWQGYFKLALLGFSWHWQDGIVGLLLLTGILLSGRPSEYIIGGRDHGVYINTGIHIAQTGGIIVHDTEITAVPPELRETLVLPKTRIYQSGFPGPWSEGQRMSGLTIRDLDTGEYLPHAFHLYPALIAVFFALGSVSAALFTTMFLALLGSLAIYLTVRRLWGQTVGLLTLLLLTFSVTQVWFTGYPTAEIMIQLFFWGGLFVFVLLLEEEHRFTAVLAGACLGLLHLAKLDTVLVPPVFGLILVYLWLRGQLRPAYWWGVAVYLLLSLQALLHASFIATIYFLDHVIRNLLPAFVAERLIVAATDHPQPTAWLSRFVSANWLLLVFTVLLMVTGLYLLKMARPFLASHLARLFSQPGQWQRVGTIGLFVLLGITAVLLQFEVVPALNKTAGSVHLSRLYLTRAGLIVGLLGSLLLLYQARTTAQRIALFVIVGNIAPLYILGAGTSPDHFWVIRRFLPLTFPAFMLGMAWFAYMLASWPRGQWASKLAALGVIVLILAGFLQHIRYIANVTEYAGLTDQLETMAEELPDDAILLLQMGIPAQQFGLPLWFLFDKSIFSIRAEVREDPLLETAVSHWLMNGKAVYWIATAETPPPRWANWQQTLQFSYQIDVPEMERPLDRIPHQLQQLQMQLDVYALTEQ